MRGLTWLVALSPIVVLAGCGGAGAPSTRTSSPPPLPRAVGPANPQSLSAARHAAAHTLTLRAAVSLEIVSPASVPYPPITGAGAFDLQAASGHEVAHDSTGTETLVFLPARIFDRRPPAEAAALPKGRPWIRADFDENVKDSPYMAQFLLRLEQRDPGFLLAEVAWGARDAAPLGSATIHGVQTTGYLVHVDAARAAAAASGARARGFVRIAALIEDALGGGNAATQEIALWVDRSDRIVSLRTPAVGTGGGTTLMTLTSFGIPVELNPPASTQTVGLDALIDDHD